MTRVLMVTTSEIYPVRSGYTEACSQIFGRLKLRYQDVELEWFRGRPLLGLSSGDSKSGSFGGFLGLIGWGVIRRNISVVFLCALLKTIISKNVDLVQVEGFEVSPVACFAALLTRRPSVIHDYNLPNYPTNAYGWFRKALGGLFVAIGILGADAVCVTMESERTFLGKMGFSTDRIFVLRNGADVEKFNLREEELNKLRDEVQVDSKDPIIVFIGDFDWEPNREAARIISNEIAPRVCTGNGSAKFLLIGGVPSQDLTHPSLIFLQRGSVRSLKLGRVGIAPVLHGGGTSMKVLDYMAAGLPVVATSFGIRGLGFRNGIHGYVADDFEEFSKRVLELIDSRDLQVRMGKEGRKLVELAYGWDRIVDTLVRIHQSAIGGDLKP